MSQPLVLAIEPDLRQAAIVKRIVREKVLADVAVVDSRDAAIEAMRTCMPDVLLLSALLSPRDEDELIAHLKTLDNAGHLQTHTIPQLASALQPGEGRGGRGLLSAFRKKKDPGPANGCDPDLFGDEIRVFLKRAEEKKRQLQDSNHTAPDMRPSAAGATRAAAVEDAAAPADQGSSWSSPFEWKPAGSSARRAPDPAPPAAPFAAPVASREPIAIPESIAVPEPIAIPEPIAMPEPRVASPEPSIVEPPSVIADSAPAIFEPAAPVAETAAFAGPAAAPELTIPEPVALAVEAATPISEPAAAVAEPQPAIPEPPAAIDYPPTPSVKPRKRDRGFKIADPGAAIRDAGLVALGLAPRASWLRRESGASDAADRIEDVRALLSTLAVPSSIASVSYPRGCRIRRVRVPAVADPESGETAGPVLASHSAGDHRDRRPTA